MALLKEEVTRKEKVIEELEDQLEESTPVSANQSVASLSTAGVAQSGSSTYKIDDVTLRSLFFSYLTSEKDKQPEIAMVMSSILGYNQEVGARLDSTSNNESFRSNPESKKRYPKATEAGSDLSVAGASSIRAQASP